MLKYLVPNHWFFVAMAFAITCYMAYNYHQSKSQPTLTASPAALFRSIIR